MDYFTGRSFAIIFYRPRRASWCIIHFHLSGSRRRRNERQYCKNTLPVLLYERRIFAAREKSHDTVRITVPVGSTGSYRCFFSWPKVNTHREVNMIVGANVSTTAIGEYMYPNGR